MIDRFLKYSLENEKKICAVLMMDDVLTCAYARGDQGELESL